MIKRIARIEAVIVLIAEFMFGAARAAALSQAVILATVRGLWNPLRSPMASADGLSRMIAPTS